MDGTTLYKKQGRRYIPVAEFDTYDAWPKGAHLVISKPGSRVIRFDIEPDDAPLIAAAEKYRGQILECVLKHMELRPCRRQLTLDEAAAWRRFQKAMGGNIYSVEQGSVSELADAVVEILINGAKEESTNHEDTSF